MSENQNTVDPWQEIYVPVYVRVMAEITAREPLFRREEGGFSQKAYKLTSNFSHWERAEYAHAAAMAALTHWKATMNTHRKPES